MSDMMYFLCVLMIIILGTVRCLTFTQHGTTDDTNSFECNTNVSLVCQTQNGKDIMILEINNTQMVVCFTRCYVITPLLGKYTVTHNFDEGTIRLDIPEITDADASNEFICRGDSTSISIKPIIKVFPQKFSTELIINEMNGTNVVEIKALTGCVLLQYNLTFIWNKTRYSNGSILEPLSTGFIIKNTDSAEDSKCIPSDHCGGEARLSTLTFTEETSGGIDYFFTCTIVINENVTRSTPQTYTVISERTFALKEGNVNDVNLGSTGCFSETGCTIGVAIAISVFIILLVVIIICAILRKRKSVNELADFPTGLRLITKTETSATFTWTPGLYPENQQRFRLCFKRLRDEYSSLKEITINGTNGTIQNLQPGCLYQCYVYAMTGNRKSGNSKRLDFTTLGLPDSPTKFEIIEVTENSFLLHWTPGRYRKYDQTFVLECKDTNTGKQNVIHIEERTADSIPLEHRLKYLFAGTEYKLMLYAENQIGCSARIGPIIQTTLGIPGAPTHLQAVPDTVSETTVTMTWKPELLPQPPSEFVCCNIMETEVQLSWNPVIYTQKQSFYLTYTSTTDQYSEVIPFDTNQETVEYSVSNLSPGTVYEFSVWAFFGILDDRKISDRCEIQMITTKGLPDDPVDFHLVDDTLTETTAEFRWKPGKYRKYEQIFVISYWLKGDEVNITNVTVNDTHQTSISHSVKKLQVGKQYGFCILAQNEIGNSNISKTVFVQAKGLPDEPRHFRCVDDLVTETTATFMWEPGGYRRYKQTFVLTYCLEHDREQTFKEEVEDTTENHITHTVSGLKEGKQYEFQIRAKNIIGVSKSCKKQLVQTKGLPEEPKHFRLVDNRLTETSATFTWIPGVYRKYAPIFVMRYYATNTEIHQYEEKVEDTFESSITHTVINLKEGTKYVFVLHCMNAIGVSNATDPIIVETKGKPDDPADLIATPKSATSITIRWTPGQYRRDIQHFVFKYSRVTRSSKRKWKTLTYQETLIYQEKDSNQLHYEITGLRPASRYEVFVYAANRFGKSASTPVQQVSTEVLAKHQHNEEMNEHRKLAYELQESEYSLTSSEVLNKIQTQPVCRLGGSITTLHIYFTSRNNHEPRHPFFPEMIEAFSSLLKCNAHLECVILYKMKVGDKELEIVKLSKEDIQAISTYVNGKTNIVQLCTEAIGRQILLWNETQFDAQDFKIEEFNSNIKHTFADSVILKLVCLDLIKCNIEIKEAYPSMLGAVELPSLVCFLDRNIEVPSFRGFPLKMRIIDDFVNESSKLENSVEKETDEYKRVLKQYFEDINVTHAEHSRNLLSKHSNIEALSVSFVKMSENGAVQICPCIVVYCKFKSAVPYKEDTFPRTLHHPLKNISFQTDVREGYFTLCPYFAQGSKEWNRELAIGCSIGEINTDIATTVGPFVDVIETHETCFLTVRHLFLPITRGDDQLEGLKVVQPADCDLPPIQHIKMPGRECGAVVASVFSEEIDAALVKVADERKPARGHFVTVTREELRKAGLSQSHIPTFDNGDMLTAAGLQIGGDATRPILKIGSRTGLTMGQLCTVDGIVKLTNDPLGFDFGYNGISMPHYFQNQLLVRSFHNQPFCLPGDSGSAVFLLDSGLRLKCIGIVIGIFSDYQAVVTPIKSVLDILGQKYGNRTLILKQFNLNEMEIE